MTGPAFQKMSPSWVAMPTGPETGGGAVGSVANEWTSEPRPSTIRPSAALVWVAPICTAVAGSWPVYSP